MKTGITKTAPRISDKSAEFYREKFESLNAGLEYVLDAFPGLYARTLHSLRGRFSRGELMLILDVLNGIWLTPGLAGQHALANVGDGVALDRLDEKWGVDGQDLTRKIAALTICETACLELWAQAFWIRPEEIDISAYVEELT